LFIILVILHISNLIYFIDSVLKKTWDSEVRGERFE